MTAIRRFARRMRAGALVGIISPSSPLAGMCPRRFRRGTEAVEALGWRVAIGDAALSVTEHTAGSAEDRAGDINRMVANPDVRLILATVGGYNSNQLLDLIDFDAMARDPKILLGYSDYSAVLLGAYASIGLVGFLGPALLPQFGEFGGLDEYTKTGLMRSVAMAQAPGLVPHSYTQTTEVLAWDKADSRRRVSQQHPGPWTVQRGEATGVCIACNLGTLLALSGTRWWPDMSGVVLCIEDDEIESPATVEQMLTHLRQMGVFETIAALVVGRFHPSVGLSDRGQLGSLLRRNAARKNLPIAADLDFGHTDPLWTLPVGCRMRLAAEDHVTLELLEAGVIDDTGSE